MNWTALTLELYSRMKHITGNKTGFFTNSAADRRFNTLIELLKSDETEPGDSQAVTLKERFLAHMYNAITIAQHFNE